MITPGYAQTMARYNTWQNINIYEASERLSDADRKSDRGAFFGSIHATLNHILWADQMWLSRFGASPPPQALTIAEGVSMISDFGTLKTSRVAFDDAIERWARNLTPDALAGDLEFRSASFNQTVTKPRTVLVAHIFNHQTHHRGQVHAMLTGLGVKSGQTDLPMYSAAWDAIAV